MLKKKDKSSKIRSNNESNTSVTTGVSADGTATTTKKRYRLNKKRFFKTILSIILLIILAIVAYSTVVIIQAPKIDTNDIYSILSQSSVIYDEDGKEVDTIYSDENRTNIAYKDLPKNLVNAFVALEDKTFWDHHGFNFIRILGAIKDKIVSGGSVSGTSTITQQLARNLFLKETMSDHSIKRKIIEAYYTVILESKLSKEEIIEAYLNTIYLGYNCNGVEAAAQAYFSKDAKDLTLEQCAALASLPQAPSEYQLVEVLDSTAVTTKDTNILKRSTSGTYVLNDEGKDRRDTCLKFMLEQKMITQKQYDKAKKVSLKKMIKPQYNNDTTKASYFSDYVIEEVISDLQKEKGWDYDTAWDKVYKGGLKIYSTLDTTAQNVIEREFDDSSNFPTPVGINYDEAGNILNDSGEVVLRDYNDYFNDDGDFTLSNDEVTVNKDGSITIKSDKRLNIYKTEANGKTDYSIEFKDLYIFESGTLYSISGGYINIPQKYKTADSDNNITISADLLKNKDYSDLLKVNDDGTVTIPPKTYTLNQKVIQPQSAMTIVDNETGQIRAMVGGRKTTGKMLYNRAINPRQPGSSIKPLAVYSAALEQSAEEAAAGNSHYFRDYGIDSQGSSLWGSYLTASSIVIDEKTVVNGKAWPENAGGGYSGSQTMRTALQQSINTCAVKIFLQVGDDFSAALVKKYGITTLVTDGSVNDLNPAALALGGMTKGVTTLEMASAYTVYPNNGTRKETTSYTKVLDSKGNTIIKKDNQKDIKVLDKGVAWIMTDLLKSVVSNGIGSAASITGVQSGGKTGTTSDQYDIWFDGFTPTYAASLWIGNDINIELSSMSGYAASLWGRIMDQIPNAKSGSYKSAPSNVVYKNGEYYASGTEVGLVSKSNFSKTVTICSESGALATSACPDTESKTYNTYNGTESVPKYYCNIHNPDPDKYPIAPNKTLEQDAQKDEEEKKAEEEKKKVAEEKKKEDAEKKKTEANDKSTQDSNSNKTDSTTNNSTTNNSTTNNSTTNNSTTNNSTTNNSTKKPTT